MKQTSLEAYQEVLLNLGQRQIQVLKAVRANPHSTNLELSKILNLPINSITPRTNELVKQGHITITGQRACRYGKRQSRTHTAQNNGGRTK